MCFLGKDTLPQGIIAGESRRLVPAKPVIGTRRCWCHPPKMGSSNKGRTPRSRRFGTHPMTVTSAEAASVQYFIVMALLFVAVLASRTSAEPQLDVGYYPFATESLQEMPEICYELGPVGKAMLLVMYGALFLVAAPCVQTRHLHRRRERHVISSSGPAALRAPSRALLFTAAENTRGGEGSSQSGRIRPYFLLK